MHALRYVLPALLALTLAACAPGAYDGGSTASADGVSASAAASDAPPACPDTISIRDFAFEPASCSVEAGSTLTFVNDDDVPHTATSEDGAAATFDTGTLQPGESATITVDSAGASPYFCEIHPSMQATIEVLGEADAGGQANAADQDDDADDDGY